MPEAQVLGKGGCGSGERKSLLRHGQVTEPVLLKYWRYFLRPLWAKVSILILKMHLTTELGERARDVAIERLGHPGVHGHTPSPIKIVIRWARDECFLQGLLRPGLEDQQIVFRDTCGIPVRPSSGVASPMGGTTGSCSPPGVWTSAWDLPHRPSSLLVFSLKVFKWPWAKQ